MTLSRPRSPFHGFPFHILEQGGKGSVPVAGSGNIKEIGLPVFQEGTDEAALDFPVRRHHLLVHQHPDEGGARRLRPVFVDNPGEEEEGVSFMEGDDPFIDLEIKGAGEQGNAFRLFMPVGEGGCIFFPLLLSCIECLHFRIAGSGGAGDECIGFHDSPQLIRLL